MTSRERILATLGGQIADRTPVAPFVHNSTVLAWKQNPNADVISGTIEFCKYFGFDIIHRNCPVRHSDFGTISPNWKVRISRITSGNETTVTTRVTTPDGVLTQKETRTRLTIYQTVVAQVEYLLKSEEDFRIFRRHVPPPTMPNFSPLHRIRTLLGNDGVSAPWVWGVFNYMAGLRSLEELLMDPYAEPKFYKEFAEFSVQRLIAAMKPLLKQGVDLLSYTGNLAGGTMVGPDYFHKYVLPYEKELIDFIQARCLGVIYHNCGDADNMIDCYNRLMPVCYESMTEPPFADNSLEKCLEEFDPRITLIGNVDQISFLRQANAGEVREKAQEILCKASGRPRFILGTSDLLEEGTPEENLYALARAVRRPSIL